MKIQTHRSNAAKQISRALVAGVFLALTINAARATIPQSERAVLDALFTQTGSSPVLSSNGWEGPEGSECSWLGITCDIADDDDHVDAIALSGLGLTGTLPDISALRSLQSFDVSNNHLGGALPALTALMSLQSFNASQNQFTGPIAPLSQPSVLETFNVEGNLLDGNAPDLRSQTALRAFLVGNNKLSGPAPLPPDPSVLGATGSSLCPNFLGPASSPESATDLIWDDATDNDPWTEGCTAAPVVVATAVPAPTLAPASLLLLIGLCGITGGILARFRAART